MRTVCFLSISFLLSVSSYAQETFDACFNGKQLRIDFALCGNAVEQSAALMQLREEPVWGGPRENLTDPFEYGGYLLKACDKASGKLIYSRGFNTLFEEWRTTEQARTETQAWVNSIVMPFPHRPVTAVILAHNRSTNNKDTLMKLDIDPSSIFIERSRLKDNPVTDIQIQGEPASKVDLAFVAEGYSASEKDKFQADAKRFTDALFAMPPYDLHRKDFNVRAVFLESEDSGTDFSGRGIFKNTALNAGFYTFGTDRYLTTPDMKSIRDAVWNIPCDAVFVLVNSEVYGGGGMYNFYAIGTADNERTIQVFVHEFGHSFAGLADEYFSSETSYNDFYNLNFEPWEPNITTLIDFDKKWKDMLPAGTPVPTPPETPYSDKLGVFEGGGYLAKGIYRPMDHCMMRDLKPFCPVCSRAIVRMIDYLSDRKLLR
ncbi:MAG: IgA Peptidase M64 [Tannerella sp.]|jgi:hypothetical protein|nr:IgA Peptidase M64 [Tannerella sp.]